MKRSIISIVVIILVLCLAGCTSSKDAFLGKWQAQKIVVNSQTIDFDSLSKIIDNDLSIEFSKDGKYVTHYFVNGKEGSAYPQYGTFTVENNTIALSNGSTGQITAGILVLSFEDGAMKHYYRKTVD